MALEAPPVVWDSPYAVDAATAWPGPSRETRDRLLGGGHVNKCCIYVGKEGGAGVLGRHLLGGVALVLGAGRERGSLRGILLE